MPNATVIHMKRIVFFLSFSLKRLCAMVIVIPELKSKAVLIVGNQKGVMVSKGSIIFAGEAVIPAAMLGQTDLNSGHKTALLKFPSAGTE